MKSFSKIIIAMMILSSSASAQTFTQPGTVELGGDISASFQRDVYIFGSTSIFSFNPYAGIMVARGFELGLTPGITTLSNGNLTFDNYNIYFTIAYNINTQSNLYPYIEVVGGYNESNVLPSTTGGHGVGVDGGFKIFIKGRSMMLFKAEYLYQTYNAPPNYLDRQTGILNSFTLGIGFRIFIGKGTRASTSG